MMSSVVTTKKIPLIQEKARHKMISDVFHHTSVRLIE